MYNKVAEQIKNISAPIHEKVVSKFNKIDFDQIDVERVWEIIYLIMLAFYVGVNVLTSTMFEIAWPPYFFQTFRSVCVTLVVIRLIIIKDMPKKKFVAMIVISFVFLMSHYMSGYGLPIDLLILVLGAYNVDFRKILKTYIAVWSVLLVITIIGAMTGLAENLVYYQGEGGERVRMALGMNYPTDLAAYVAFLMFAYVCVRDEYITYLEIGVMAALAVVVYYATDARTDFLIMLLLDILVLIVKIFNENFEKLIQMKYFKIAMAIFPLFLALFIWRHTAIYRSDKEFMVMLDQHLSARLALGERAMREYPPKLFGQYVIEKGAGGSVESNDFYFFIDSSYISITIKYGIVCMAILLAYFGRRLKQLCDNKKSYMIVILLLLFIQSTMEHHLIQYWYNPFLLMILADMKGIMNKNAENDFDKTDLLDLN